MKSKNPPADDRPPELNSTTDLTDAQASIEPAAADSAAGESTPIAAVELPVPAVDGLATDSAAAPAPDADLSAAPLSAPGSEYADTTELPEEPRIPGAPILKDAERPPQVESFAELGLSRLMLNSLNRAGFTKPTPIQAAMIPYALSGRDMVGQARTGTGKTGAFLVPIFETIQQGAPGPQALIMAPTRELAQQIGGQILLIGYNLPFRHVCITGGELFEPQVSALRQGVDIVVGTPGRLIDLYKKRILNLDHVKSIVLDEADRMLDFGFRPDIEYILKRAPKDRQTLMLSATYTDDILYLTKRYMRNPEMLRISRDSLTVPSIGQYYRSIERPDKFNALVELVKLEKPGLAIIFCNTRALAKRLASKLLDVGLNAHEIHGDLEQKRRNTVMGKFRRGDVHLLVATDVASRGIDVDGITHIVNYDVPQRIEDYVHRIGRTGRMERAGRAITFVTHEEGPILSDIEQLINQMLVPWTPDLGPVAQPAPAPVSVAEGDTPAVEPALPTESDPASGHAPVGTEESARMSSDQNDGAADGGSYEDGRSRSRRRGRGGRRRGGREDDGGRGEGSEATHADAHDGGADASAPAPERAPARVASARSEDPYANPAPTHYESAGASATADADTRDARDARNARNAREPRDSRDARDSRGSRSERPYRDERPYREERSSASASPSRDTRDTRDSRSSRDYGRESGRDGGRESSRDSGRDSSRDSSRDRNRDYERSAGTGHSERSIREARGSRVDPRTYAGRGDLPAYRPGSPDGYRADPRDAGRSASPDRMSEGPVAGYPEPPEGWYGPFYLPVDPRVLGKAVPAQSVRSGGRSLSPDRSADRAPDRASDRNSSRDAASRNSYAGDSRSAAPRTRGYSDSTGRGYAGGSRSAGSASADPRYARAESSYREGGREGGRDGGREGARDAGRDSGRDSRDSRDSRDARDSRDGGSSRSAHSARSGADDSYPRGESADRSAGHSAARSDRGDRFEADRGGSAGGGYSRSAEYAEAGRSEGRGERAERAERSDRSDRGGREDRDDRGGRGGSRRGRSERGGRDRGGRSDRGGRGGGDRNDRGGWRRREQHRRGESIMVYRRHHAYGSDGKSICLNGPALSVEEARGYLTDFENFETTWWDILPLDFEAASPEEMLALETGGDAVPRGATAMQDESADAPAEAVSLIDMGELPPEEPATDANAERQPSLLASPVDEISEELSTAPTSGGQNINVDELFESDGDATPTGENAGSANPASDGDNANAAQNESGDAVDLNGDHADHADHSDNAEAQPNNGNESEESGESEE